MTLELCLDYKVMKPEECPHVALRYDGIMFEDSPEDSFPQVTCFHPNRPHCGGTFDARRFNRNGVVLFEGKVYSVEYLSEWYGAS